MVDKKRFNWIKFKSNILLEKRSLDNLKIENYLFFTKSFRIFAIFEVEEN
jgi:hypothetical protein